MNCPICDNKTDNFWDFKLSIAYHYCRVCDYIFKDPSHHQSLDEQKKRYDLHENDPDNEGYRKYFDRFLDFVLPKVGKGGRALDFGSGASDLLSQMLSKAGFGTVHYDPIYHPDISYARYRYDLIVSTEVFEHLSDPLGMMHHLAGLLATDGYLALQTQFHPKGRGEFLEWYYRLDPTHIGFFTPVTLQALASKSSLKYLDDDGTNKIIFQNH